MIVPDRKYWTKSDVKLIRDHIKEPLPKPYDAIDKFILLELEKKPMSCMEVSFQLGITVHKALVRLDALVMSNQVIRIHNGVVYYKLKRDLRRIKKIIDLEFSQDGKELPGAFINETLFKSLGDKRFKCIWQIVRE